ncbi:hypothetical protein DM02DRAFT_64593 [Periconia macrospinosa]|uniref:Uncharacterized protein n=1 Tax=Periconia macrospinosa TaxID=97972 RepID=A0A2V1DIE1_9PLEO|nr:hypothetical protein DM02DRAFT_64593 [Periconia macrospinosa]
MYLLKPLVFAVLSGIHGAHAAICNTQQTRSNDIEASGYQIARQLFRALDAISDDLCKGQAPYPNGGMRTHQYNSLVFSIYGQDASNPAPDCSKPFADIIDQCTVQGNVWGGNTSSQGLLFEIQNGAYPERGLSPARLELRKRADQKEIGRGIRSRGSSRGPQKVF